LPAALSGSRELSLQSLELPPSNLFTELTFEPQAEVLKSEVGVKLLRAIGAKNVPRDSLVFLKNITVSGRIPGSCSTDFG
jgi:hypothetical protein